MFSLRPLSWRPPDRLQTKTSTSFGRYGEILAALAALLPARGEALRLLSFGSSLGLECFTLRGFFPQAEIHGVEIDRRALATARGFNSDPRIAFHDGREADWRRQGPFDAVLAMSVLCRYPASSRVENLGRLLPAARVAEQVTGLLELLAPGGLLVAYNASYAIGDLALPAPPAPVIWPTLADSGFVDRFRADGSLLARTRKLGGRFLHDFHGTAADYSEERFRCVFWRKPGGALPLPPPPAALDDSPPLLAERVTSPLPLTAAGGPVTFAAEAQRLVQAPDGSRHCRRQALRRHPSGEIAAYGWFPSPRPLDMVPEGA